MIAVVFVRRRTFLSARPLAMASGSGSLCSMIRTRSASLKYRWYCCTLARVSDRLNSVSSGPPNSSAIDRYETSGNSACSSSARRWAVPAPIEHVDERAARIAHRLENFSEAAAAGVLDDHARAWAEVRFQVG